jgi:hypothetical protein
MGKPPASILKPAQAEFFELLLVQHVKSLAAAHAPSPICDEMRKPIKIKGLESFRMPVWIGDEIAVGLPYAVTKYRDLSMLSTYRQNMSKISIKIDTI